MPSLVKAAILGILQGVTEFLPVSSTAHLLIGRRLLGFEDPDGAFTTMIQLGSILAVMWLYRARIIEVVLGLPTSVAARRFAMLVVIATVPAVLAGALLADYVTHVLYHSLSVLAVTFIAGGVVMLLVERSGRAATIHSMDDIPATRALGIGACQALALVPGVSRSGATIVGGLSMALDRRVAAEFSFFLAMPIMIAAFAKGLLDLRGHVATGQAAEIAVGFVAAFVGSAAVVKPFLSYVGRAGFAPFAWYRMIAGLMILAALAVGFA